MDTYVDRTPIAARVDDGDAVGVLFAPARLAASAHLPLLVHFPDAGGIRPAMERIAGRFASHGYAVLVVDPYWRNGPFAPFDFATVWSDAPERARIGALMASVLPERLFADTRALVAAIGDPRVDTGRFATFGYCMGGRMAFLAAASMPDRVVAAAPIHAGGLVGADDKSPHLRVPAIRGALYLGVADQDASFNPSAQATLRQALDAAGVRYEMEVMTGARHGYAVPDFPVFDHAAAERHYERSLALFDAALRG